MKNKLLYITDQEEYNENRTISVLFNKYLKEYWDINIVYMTKYKYSFQEKDNNFIVPLSKHKNIIEYLVRRDINLSEYNVVIVRNSTEVLKNVLDNQEKYSYKIAYRISYPIKHHRLEFMNTIFPYSIAKKIILKNKIKNRDLLINKCNLFLPSSSQANKEFYSTVNIESFSIPSGLDPSTLNKNIINSDDSPIKFIYVGYIDKIREFNIILDSFSIIENNNWLLTILTTDKKYIQNILKKYSKLKNNISLGDDSSFEKSKEEINRSDIGIALMPRNQFYDTVMPSKVMNYYSCAVPTILTSNEKNHSIFNEDEAYFCNFNVKDISGKIDNIMNESRTNYSNIGNRGQEKLIFLKKDFKVIAKDLSDKLNILLK